MLGRDYTPEEKEAAQARLTELRAGTKAEQIKAVIMDSDVGNFGLYEHIAQIKIDELVRLGLLDA